MGNKKSKIFLLLFILNAVIIYAQPEIQLPSEQTMELIQQEYGSGISGELRASRPIDETPVGGVDATMPELSFIPIILMGLIYLFIKRRKIFSKNRSVFILSGFLFSGAASVSAQCTLQLTQISEKHPLCSNDGGAEYKITTSGIDDPGDIQYKIYLKDAGAGSALWTGINNDFSIVLDGLYPGTYVLDVEAFCRSTNMSLNESDEFTLARQGTVTPPNFTATITRKSMEGFSSGEIRLDVTTTNNNGPFHFIIRNAPSEYGNLLPDTIHTASSLTVGQSFTFDDLPSGDYEIMLMDNCGDGQVRNVTMDEFKDGYRFDITLISSSFIIPKLIDPDFTTCDQMTTLMTPNPYSEFYSYQLPEIRGRYYEYTFYLPADEAGLTTLPDDQWKDLPSERYLSYPIPAGSSLMDIRSNKTEKLPRLAVRVKGTNDIYKSTINIYDPYITPTPTAAGCNDRNYIFTASSLAPICFPYTWEITDDDTGLTVASSEPGSPVDEYTADAVAGMFVICKAILSPGNYTVTVTDGDGYVFDTSVAFSGGSYTNGIYMRDDNRSSGAYCEYYNYFMFYLRGTTDTPIAGSTIIFNKEKSDPRVLPPVHDTLRLASDYIADYGWDNCVFPWSENYWSYSFSENPVEDFPLGAYVYFTVIDSCGIEKEVSGYRSYNYREYDHVDELKIDTEDLGCGEVKITPTNYTEMMVYYPEKDYSSPVTTRAYVWIVDSPSGANVNYSSGSYCYTLGDYIRVDKSGEYTFRVCAAHTTGSLDLRTYCYVDYTVYIEVPELSYDVSRSVAYRCFNNPDYAYMLFRSENSSGNCTYELFDPANMSTPLATSNDGKFENFTLAQNLSTLSLRVTDNDCGNFYTETVQVLDLHNVTVAWTDDNTRKCVGDPIYLYALNLGDEDADGEGKVYTWTFPDGVTKRYTRDLVIEAADLSHNGKFKVEVKLQGCDTGETVSAETPEISVASKTMYWRHDAVNSDWHDSQNWIVLDDQGNTTTAQAIPAPCTTVHIPGYTDNFPNLSAHSTPRSIWDPFSGSYINLGLPACDTIIYHYGGETVSPNYLDYNFAKVQYNFGYYKDFSEYTQANGKSASVQPNYDIDDEDYPALTTGKKSKVIDRANWHLISSPLKHTLTGDFNLAGYPFTYQRLYNAENPSTGLTAHDDFTKSFRNLNLHLSDVGHAIALLAADYYNSLGWRNHKNLEAVKGIIEIPFYMDNQPDIMGYHLQTYDDTNFISYLQYYKSDTIDLRPLGEHDEYIRDYKGYRFVFENINDTVSIENIKGTDVAVYRMKLNHVNTSDTTETHRVLIGNPLMCHIDFESIYRLNDDVIEDFYWLFDSESGYFPYYRIGDPSPDLSSYIAPLQGFIIQVIPGLSEYELVLPLEGNFSVIPGSNPPPSRSAEVPASLRNTGRQGWITISGVTPVEDSLSDSIRIKSKVYFGSGYSDIPKLVYPDNLDKKAETFIVGADGRLYSERIESDYPAKINFGLESVYEDKITLHIEPGGNLITRAILYDTDTNTRTDVTKGGYYTFQHRVNRIESGVKGLDTGRFELALEYGLNSEGITNDNLYMSVKADRSTLSVIADEALFSVEMIDISGLPVIYEAGISRDIFQKQIKILPGVYLVKVQTQSGLMRMQKILVK